MPKEWRDDARRGESDCRRDTGGRAAERERCAKMLDQRASELEIEFPNGGAVASIHELVEQAKRIREGGHA